MARAYIGLGANLGDPAKQVADAIEALAARFPLHARSSLYRSTAIGMPGQPDYCNAASCIEATVSPQALMETLLEIERAAGRVRDGTRWGPRRLDLDLLHYEGVALDAPRLRLPHPEIGERNFVLWPLAEIASDLEIPGVGRVVDAAIRSSRAGLEPWLA